MKDKEITLEQYIKRLERLSDQVDLHGKPLSTAIEAEEQLAYAKKEGFHWRGNQIKPVFYERPSGAVYYTYRVVGREEWE